MSYISGLVNMQRCSLDENKGGGILRFYKGYRVTERYH